MAEYDYFEALKQGLEEAVAYKEGDRSRCRTVVREIPSREKCIPFEITADPFYSESNMKYLERVISDIETGRAKLVEHELIED